MVDMTKMLAIAIGEIGYREKASNAYLDDPIANAGNGNYTKYGDYLDRISDWYNGKKNGYDWCNQYADYPFVKAYGVDLARKLLCRPLYSAGAGCVYSAQYLKNAGRWVRDPKAGDLIYFDYGDGIGHIGIVTAVTDTQVITVEGNSNGMVRHCEYPLDASYIAGYARPCYELYDEEGAEAPADETPQQEKCHLECDLPIIRYGDVSWHVALMQIILMGRGYTCGPSGADGDYGGQTKVALYEFQLANGLTTDCICEETTWKKLLE